MRRNPWLIALALALGITCTSPIVLADGRGHCSLRSVAGTYGYTVNGTRIGVGPAASVGYVTLDRDGTLTGAQTASFNGTIATETLTGTYTVNDDCTGSATIDVVSSIPAFNRTSTLDLMWDADSARFRFIFTNASTILTGDAEKVH